jgi:REP element-mobilizing transposase RayT
MARQRLQTFVVGGIAKLFKKNQNVVMPRQPRLDAPSVIHHVTARGIHRRRIFWGNSDRNEFVRRLDAIEERADFIVYAWGLVPNHFHPLVNFQNPTSPILLRASPQSSSLRFSGPKGALWVTPHQN